MDFKEAELLINASLLFSKPSLLLIGSNGIGKTQMLLRVTEYLKEHKINQIDIFGYMDMGGLTQLEQSGIESIVLSDLQNILSRKPQIRTSTFSKISEMISEGTKVGNASFNNIKFTNPKQGKTFNFIMAGTYNQLYAMIKEHHFDILNRAFIIFVDRNRTDFAPRGYELHLKPRLRYDKKKYRQYKNKRYKNLIPRHIEMKNEINKELLSMNVENINNITREMFIFNPSSVEGNINPADVLRYLKPLGEDNGEEIEDTKPVKKTEQKNIQQEVSFGTTNT